VRSLAEPGQPAEVLLRVAEREAADVITVGSRGLGGTARQLGSTSDAVVRESPIPVVVVPSHP
jgi:nucleotide-binding universal stress UspA family protein